MADWVLVPKVATEGMLDAARQPLPAEIVSDERDPETGCGPYTIAVGHPAPPYAAMLAAAPTYEITEADIEAAMVAYFAEEALRPVDRMHAVLTQFVKRLGGG